MISAIILTKNEEKNIEACLDSISWIEDKIVIDDHSTDKTVELAKKKGAKVFVRTLYNNFSDQRNYGLDKAQGDWILFIDADERVSPALWYEIMAHTSEAIEEYVGFYIKRQDTMWGKVLKYGETGNIILMRLARKGIGKWEGQVHEKWNIKGKTAVLNNPMDHYPHQTITEFLQEINFYTDLRSEELFNKKVKSNWLSIIVYPKSKFVLNFIFKAGYRDGLQGLVFAILMSFHSFLVRAKLWNLNQKKR